MILEEYNAWNLRIHHWFEQIFLKGPGGSAAVEGKYMYCHILLLWLQVGGGSCRSAAATLVRLARMVGANSSLFEMSSEALSGAPYQVSLLGLRLCKQPAQCWGRHLQKSSKEFLLQGHAALPRSTSGAGFAGDAISSHLVLFWGEHCSAVPSVGRILAVLAVLGILKLLDMSWLAVLLFRWFDPLSRLCWGCTWPKVEERASNSLLLDVGATDGDDVAHVLTDGLAGGESRAQPVIALLAKSRREKSFPTELLKEGLAVNIEQASATQAADKTSILNSIAFPRSRTIALNSNYSTNHPSYQIVNAALASHFALAAMYTSYLQGQDVSNLLVALQADEARTSLQLSLTECHEFTDEKLSTLLEHLPRCLQNLRLDLGFTGLKCFPVFPGSNIALQKLVLRFTGSLQSIAGFSTMLQHLQPSLRHLELWFSNLPFLEDLEFGPGNDTLLRLHLVEMMLYVEGCPLVSKTSKQSLCLGVLSTACWPIMSYIIYPHIPSIIRIILLLRPAWNKGKFTCFWAPWTWTSTF